MNKKMRRELKESFWAPEPERRDDFLSGLRSPREPLYRFVLTQLGYIRKRGWAAAFLVLLVILGVGEYWEDISDAALFWNISAFLPFFALTAIVEVGRSNRRGMSELESCTRYHLPEILLVRMGSIGALNLTVLLGVYFFLQSRISYGTLRTIVYLFLPYVLTSALTLLIQNTRRKCDVTVCCGAVGILVSLCTAILPRIAEYLYAEKYFIAWALFFMFACGLMLRQLWKMKENMEEGLWNLYLTE